MKIFLSVVGKNENSFLKTYFNREGYPKGLINQEGWKCHNQKGAKWDLINNFDMNIFMNIFRMNIYRFKD